MEDKLSRKLTDLRISVTDRCRYCMPEELYGEAYEFLSRDQVLSFEEIVRLTKIFIKLGINKIRLTGGEPLVRKNIEELISLISRLDKNIDLAMTTNGYLLNKFSNILFSSGLRRLTISLDSLDNDIFQKMSGKKFSVEDILKGISSAKEAGFKNIKINSVIKKGVNDKGIIDLVDYCKQEGHILRFIEYMDVGTLNSWNRKSVVDSKEIIEENKSIISHGKLKLDPSQLECEWNGKQLPDKLTTTEFLLVKELAKRPGIIKERAQLMDIAYREDTDIEDRTIDSHVKRIRKKFKKVDPEFSAIETRYGSGYRWNVS